MKSWNLTARGFVATGGETPRLRRCGKETERQEAEGERRMQTGPEAGVTFRLAGSKQALILLPVFVDGQGPYSFVLDTGAGSTVVSNELADALALPRGENQDGRGAAGKMILVQSQLPSLTVGQETLASLPVSVADLSFLGRAMGVQVDGALGQSFLRHFVMTLDYAKNELKLRRPVGGTERALDEREIAFHWANPEFHSWLCRSL